MGDNETVADIIAEARDKYTVHECSQCTWRKCCSEGFGSEKCGKFRESIFLKLGIEDGYFAQLLDRLEAAWKRELFTKARKTDNSGAAVYTNDNSGDCAKMREALKAARVAILAARKKMGVDNPIILEIIDAALAAPPRNCDVGTVKDQEDRLEKFCDAHKYVGDDGANVCSRDCPCYNGMDCGLRWAQMPYEDGETGGGSHRSRNGERKAQLAGVAREAVRR